MKKQWHKNGWRSCRSRQKVLLSLLNHTDKYKCPLCRYQLIRDYTLKTLRLKIDKWNKLWSSDEQRALLIKFVESGHTWHYPQLSLLYANKLSSDFIQQIVISQTLGGAIQIHTDWANHLTNKGVYFIKREREGIPEPEYGPLLNYITCGDVHSNVIGNHDHQSDQLKIRCSSKYYLFRSILHLVRWSNCPNLQEW